MKPNADLWRANSDLTMRGYPYPSGLHRISKLLAEVSWGNDENDSLVMLLAEPEGDRVYRLWVAACCEERRDDYPRFALEVFDGDDAAIPTRLDVPKLLDWYGDHGYGGAFDEVWEGDDARELLQTIAVITGQPIPTLKRPSPGAKPPSYDDDEYYKRTQSGFKYPADIHENFRAIQTSDFTDSLIVVGQNGVYHLWVEPSCKESRSSDDAARFVLEAYTLSPTRLERVAAMPDSELKRTLGKASGATIWQGEDANELMHELEQADFRLEQRR